MKTLTTLLAFAIASLATLGADLTGTWKAEFDTQRRIASISKRRKKSSQLTKELPTEKFYNGGAVRDAKPFQALKPRQSGAAPGRSKVVSSRMSIKQPSLF